MHSPPPRPLRDRLGEIQRICWCGPLAAAWADADEKEREAWRVVADDFLRLTGRVNIDISERRRG